MLAEAAAALPAGAPEISSEVDLDLPVRSPTDATFFRIAAGASSHLVTFTASPTSGNSDLTVYGTRVGFDGAILDALPFPVGPTPGVSPPYARAKIAFNGTDWLVAWQGSPGIYAARVAADGSVRDPAGIGISLPPDMQLGNVASDGNGFLLTWDDVDGVQAALISATGTVARQFTVRAGRAGGSNVSFNGTHYLVAWSETVSSTEHVRALRLTAAGDPVGDVIDLGVGGGLIEVASNGSDWIVAHGSTGVEWRVVKADGALGATGSLASASFPLSLTYGGSGYFLSAFASARLVLARLDDAGRLLDSVVGDAGSANGSAVVYGGGSAFVAFQPLPVPGSPALGSRLSSTLALLDDPPVLLSASASWQFGVPAASDGSRFLTVWADTRDGWNNKHLYARRVGADGRPLDAHGFPVTGDEARLPNVASNGSQYLVVWENPRTSEIRGARVSTAGSVLDNAGFQIAPEGSAPAVASNGTDYYVAWGTRGIRVLTNGTVMLPTATFTTSSSAQDIAVASNGSRYLVAWSETGAIRAKRVDGAGIVLDETAIDITLGVGKGRPKVASDGTGWFVVWESLEGVRGARVLPTGVVADESDIVDNTGVTVINGGGSVAWTGETYLAVWSRREGNASGVYGRRISTCGELLDPSPFPIATNGPYRLEDFVDVTGNGLGSALVTYTRPELRLAASRARARTVTGGNPGDCDAGAGGAAGAGTGGSAGSGSGSGGRGGSDGGAAGEPPNGGAGEGPGGSPDGGTSGTGASGRAGSSSGRGGSGTDSDGGSDNGHGRGRTIVTKGCGCRAAGAKANGGVAALLFACALGTLRFRRMRHDARRARA